jgi:hypothetical protein
MSATEYPYLIIGGAPKAGTTSLFKWLSAHHEVCASSIKETRFFLDLDYPLPSAARFDGTNLDEYESFFAHCPADRYLRVDSTPDYLYSRNALRIAELLPQAKIVFLLREPVDRMVSWYKYARQRNLIDEKMGLDDYVKSQLGCPIASETPPHLRALDQCKYEKYLPAFRLAFGDRLMELDFEDIKRDPISVIKKICVFANIDPAFYEGFQFNAENVSRSARFPQLEAMYNNARRKLAYASHAHPRIKALLKIANKLIKKVLISESKQPPQPIISNDLAELIRTESSMGAEWNQRK